jgi:hypothetical protein
MKDHYNYKVGGHLWCNNLPDDTDTFTPQKGDNMKKRKNEYVYRFNDFPLGEFRGSLADLKISVSAKFAHPSDTVELFELKSLGTFKAGLVGVSKHD